MRDQRVTVPPPLPLVCRPSWTAMVSRFGEMSQFTLTSGKVESAWPSQDDDLQVRNVEYARGQRRSCITQLTILPCITFYV